MNRAFKLIFGVSLASSTVLVGCGPKGSPTAMDPGNVSATTGLEFNRSDKPSDELFSVREFAGQPVGPGLRFIEGGRHILGTFEEDVMGRRDNQERDVTVASFYMDEAEVTNLAWLEYLWYLQKDSTEQVFMDALPDTLVWVSELAFNDPYRDHYLRYPGFRFFPVVGVNYWQANNYCKWRTDMTNNKLARENGNDDEVAKAENGERIPLESGIVMPDYRLPTEAEWEYAAKGLVGTVYMDENQSQARIYPWNGHTLRNPYGEEMGTFMANFKRGRGDYGGIAGKLNDAAFITCEVYNNPPNDFGLYNMAGNVSEWVWDLYRPLNFEDMDDLNPARRNDYIDGDASNPTYQFIYNKTDYQTFIGDENSADVYVYKGGSWKDVALWLSPGTRRFLEADSSTATIGFRCAMIRAGSNQ